MSTEDVFGTRNLFWNQEHLEQKRIRKWLYHTWHSVTVTRKIHPRRPFPCAHFETSQIKSSIVSSGAATNLTLSSLMCLLMPCPTWTTLSCSFINSRPITLVRAWNLPCKQWRTSLAINKKESLKTVCDLQGSASMITTTSPLWICSVYSQKMPKIKKERHSGLDLRDAHPQFHLMQLIKIILDL